MILARIHPVIAAKIMLTVSADEGYGSSPPKRWGV